MTDSNIGGRRGRMAQDHLFILYDIMNSVINGDEEPVEVLVSDIETTFDKLSLDSLYKKRMFYYLNKFYLLIRFSLYNNNKIKK